MIHQRIIRYTTSSYSHWNHHRCDHSPLHYGLFLVLFLKCQKGFGLHWHPEGRQKTNGGIYPYDALPAPFVPQPPIPPASAPPMYSAQPTLVFAQSGPFPVCPQRLASTNPFKDIQRCLSKNRRSLNLRKQHSIYNLHRHGFTLPIHATFSREEMYVNSPHPALSLKYSEANF